MINTGGGRIPQTAAGAGEAAAGRMEGCWLIMEEKKLFIKEVMPGIFLMDEAHEATGYLVVGEKRVRDRYHERV